MINKQLITEIHIKIRFIEDRDYRETTLKESEVTHRITTTTGYINLGPVADLAQFCAITAVNNINKPEAPTPSPDAFIESV